jgi:glyoxylase-like metal-dependent hydrolase (beta-lactamase superfamily II)
VYVLILKKNGYEVYPIIVPDKYLKSINFFLIKGEHSLTLIDAGLNTEKCWSALQATLKENDLVLSDLTEIILTHHHSDHVGLVNRIVSQHPIPVYASNEAIPRLKRDKAYLKMRSKFFEKLYSEAGCGTIGAKKAVELHEAIEKNEALALQADIVAITNNRLLNFTVIETPGHAPDQLAFYDEKRKWLFAGDLLIEHISSNALIGPDLNGNPIPSLSQHNDSMESCLSLDAELVFPGHGILIDKPHQLIRKRLDRVEEKAERILQLISSGISNAGDLSQFMYKKIYFQQFSLVMSEIIGHLDYLENEDKIKKDMVHGIWQYSVNQPSLKTLN